MKGFDAWGLMCWAEAAAGVHLEPCVCVGNRGTRCFLKELGGQSSARRCCCRPCWLAFAVRPLLLRLEGRNGGSKSKAMRPAARTQSVFVEVGVRWKDCGEAAAECTSRLW